LLASGNNNLGDIDKNTRENLLENYYENLGKQLGTIKLGANN